MSKDEGLSVEELDELEEMCDQHFAAGSKITRTLGQWELRRLITAARKGIEAREERDATVCEKEFWRDQHGHLNRLCDKVEAERDRLSHRVEELEGALREIKDKVGTSTEAYHIARRALEGKG